MAIVAALATTPLDVARTRVLAGDTPGGIREVVTLVSAISKKEGPSALFRARSTACSTMGWWWPLSCH